jgi:hypothetical protein
MQAWKITIGATAETGFENPGGFLTVEDLTRDGRYFVFASAVEPKGIWIQRADNPDERRVLMQDMFGALQPRVSPDRRWLAYTLILPSEPEIFAQPFDRPGDRTQVSVKGGSGAVWRPVRPGAITQSLAALMPGPPVRLRSTAAIPGTGSDSASEGAPSSSQRARRPIQLRLLP